MISIITPSNNTQYLPELYECLKEQSFTDWEWIIVLNGGAEVKFPDPRVKIFHYDGQGKVGILKKYACSKAKGSIIAEVDHDDLITSDCLEEINKAFNDDTVFAYSNCAAVNQDWSPRVFGEYYGWQTEDFLYKGHKLKATTAPEPYPSNISRLWFAPDHIRAWTKKAYEAVGGHSDMKVADDQELMIKLWLHGKFKHINKCLYIYRVHGQNTWLKHNDEVQSQMWANYNNYIFQIAEKWATDNKLRKIDLCGGHDKPIGYESIDLKRGDIQADLNTTWPLQDNSIGLIRAHDAIEHLKDPIHTMSEAYRVLAHGGFYLIDVPSTDGVGAWCDPTHVSFWNKRSFRYYTDKNIAKYIDFKGKFQILYLENIIKWDNIPYVRAHLMAIKEGPRFHGELLI